MVRLIKGSLDYQGMWKRSRHASACREELRYGWKGEAWMIDTAGEKQKEQMAIELTSLMLHKHYCENDVEALIALLDDAVHWFGAGEYEYAVGIETVAPIFAGLRGRFQSAISPMRNMM